MSLVDKRDCVDVVDIDVTLAEGELLGETLAKNTTWTCLRLNGSKVSVDGMRALCKGISTNKTLTLLSLQEVLLSHEKAVALAEALKVTSSLQTLNLGKSSAIAGIDLSPIANAMKINTSVMHLDLWGCVLDGSQICSISDALKENKTLQSLKLARCKLNGDCVKMLCEALHVNQTLTDLDLSGNFSRAEHVADALAVNKGLTKLNLSDNFLDPDGITCILNVLVKKNHFLRQLDLTHNEAGSKGANALAQVLRENQRFKWISLKGHNLGPEEATVLADALKENKGLTFLDMENNMILCQGGQAMAKALAVNRTLKVLDLKFNHLESFDAQLGIRSNCGLVHLNISRNGFRNDNDIFEALQYNGNIRVCPGVSNDVDQLCNEFKSMHLRAQQCATVLLCIRKYRSTSFFSSIHVPKEMVLLIAQCLLETRSDFRAWATDPVLLLVQDTRENRVKSMHGKGFALAFHARLLADSLRCNQSLVELDLTSAFFDQDDMMRIGQSLSNNRSLLRYKGMNGFGIEHVCVRNASLSHQPALEAVLHFLCIWHKRNTSSVMKSVSKIIGRFIWETRTDVAWLE